MWAARACCAHPLCRHLVIDPMGSPQAAAEGATLSANGWQLKKPGTDAAAGEEAPRARDVVVEPLEPSAGWDRGLVLARHELRARDWANMVRTRVCHRHPADREQGAQPAAR